MNLPAVINSDQLFAHPYNNTYWNERAIELLFTYNYLTIHNTNIIEVGAVTPYYFIVKHEIIDPADDKATEKIDAELLDYTDKNVLCISTIEHMGKADYDSSESLDPNKPARFLEKLEKEAKSYLITFPVGSNSDLDKYFIANATKYKWFGYRRIGGDPPIWQLDNDINSVMNTAYNLPFNNANSVIFVVKHSNE